MKSWVQEATQIILNSINRFVKTQDIILVILAFTKAFLLGVLTYTTHSYTVLIVEKVTERKLPPKFTLAVYTLFTRCKLFCKQT